MSLSLFTNFACDLGGNHLFGLPHWYKYLKGVSDSQGQCTPSITGLSDVWLIVAAVIEILLRIGALAAVGFIIYGGVLYTTSQGDPAKTGQAKTTLVSAIVGLAISVMAAVVVSFIAGSIS